MQLSFNVLLVMDCVTVRCRSQVQPTKMTLVRHLPSGAQIFSVLLWLILYISLYFLYNINYGVKIYVKV